MAIRRRVTMTGADKMLRRFNREVQQIKGRTRQGMRAAALLVRRESQKICPVDTGNLRGSAYTEVYDNLRKGPGAEIGYTAYYAPYVHEMPEDFNFKRPGSGPKFLERALLENTERIKTIITSHTKV